MSDLARKELDAFHALTAAHRLLCDTQALVNPNPYFPFSRKVRAREMISNARYYIGRESLKAYDIYIEQVGIEFGRMVETYKSEMSKLIDEKYEELRKIDCATRNQPIVFPAH